jgi:hypothetical protein
LSLATACLFAVWAGPGAKLGEKCRFFRIFRSHNRYFSAFWYERLIL